MKRLWMVRLRDLTRGRRPFGVILAAAMAGVAVAVLAPLSAGAASAPLSVIAGPQAPAHARALGSAPASQPIHGVVGLRPRDPAGLATFAHAVTDPSSALYRHYLTPAAFGARFGATNRAVAAVEGQLRGAGIPAGAISAHGLLVDFTATVSQAQAAFHTRLESYRLSNGRAAIAPTSAVQLPANVASGVESVIGLNTTLQPQSDLLHGTAKGHPAATAPASAAVGDGPSACTAARADASAFGGLTDQQLAAAYGVNGLYAHSEDGAGETIDIYELEPFSRADQQTFDTCYFGATQAAAMLKRLKVVPVDGGDQVGNGSGESELDVDDVSGLAPGAKIDVFEAPNDFSGLIDNFNAIVQADNAKIVSSSWYSGCEAAVEYYEPGLEQVENSIFEQGASEGQTLLEASGDDGSDGCAIHGSSPVSPILSATNEEAQPYVMSVGGTTITDATDPPAEHVWNDGNIWGAAGGGLSNVWAAPSWQTDTSVPGFDNTAIIKQAEAVSGNDFCGAAVCRETPDVSAQADEFTGAATVYESQYGGWTTFGGTSSATPLWAAMLADIATTPACTAEHGLGFVLPKLYGLASNPTEYAASFNDVTTGNDDVFDDAGGLYPATTGYDMATGLGSPRVTGPNGGPGLAYYLCASTVTAPPTVSAISPSAVPSNGGTVQIRGSGFASSGTPDVSGVQIGTVALPSKDWTVTGPTTISAKLPAASTQRGTGGAGDGTGTYDVEITLLDGATSAPNADARVTYYDSGGGAGQAPTVSGVDQSSGNEAGGLVVNVYGSSFTAGAGAPTVTFGGVASSDVVVVNGNLLHVTVPAYSSATQCATSLDPQTDVCQVEVQVTTSQGSSAELPIKREFSGPTSNEGAPGTEVAPVATEFDYVPTPKITSVSVSGGLASEAGGSQVTITGVGFGALGLEWLIVGPYQQLTSDDYSITYVSATELQAVLPAEPATTSPLTEPVYVQTLGSPNVSDYVASAPSNAGSVTYAPTPQVTSIAVASAPNAAALRSGPTTGGTELVITGKGLGDADEVTFTDVGAAGAADGFSDATAFTLEKVTPTSVTLLTPNDNPGIDQVSVCDESGCSAPAGSDDVFTFYPPGNPSVSSVNPGSGPAGTRVTITGANLGFVTGVFFGNVKATQFANEPQLTDAGSTTKVTAVAPPGTAGSTVDVRVTTLESQATGYGKSPINPAATFTYSGS